MLTIYMSQISQVAAFKNLTVANKSEFVPLQIKNSVFLFLLKKATKKKMYF